MQIGFLKMRDYGTYGYQQQMMSFRPEFSPEYYTNKILLKILVQDF
jgi:hypothetical protein